MCEFIEFFYFSWSTQKGEELIERVFYFIFIFFHSFSFSTQKGEEMLTMLLRAGADPFIKNKVFTTSLYN